MDGSELGSKRHLMLHMEHRPVRYTSLEACTAKLAKVFFIQQKLFSVNTNMGENMHCFEIHNKLGFVVK